MSQQIDMQAKVVKSSYAENFFDLIDKKATYKAGKDMMEAYQKKRKKGDKRVTPYTQDLFHALQVQKLGHQGKEINTYSVISFTPLEKYCFEYLFSIEYESIKTFDEESFFNAYLQPVLDRLHEFEINQKTSTEIDVF